MSQQLIKPPSLRDLIVNLKRLIVQFERLSARDGRSLRQQVRDCLVDCGPSSTSAVARLIRRKRADVLDTLHLMAAANEITRTPDGKWELPNA